jgi:DNA-binding CsgD family transcriptional regulator/N-acetylneuraminic acid mutarotase
MMAETNNKLSERELEILQLVATGLSNREIAQELTISPNTVKVHLSNIFEKINVSSRTEATFYGIEHGLVDVPGSEGNSAEPASLSMVQNIPWMFAAILIAVVLFIGVGVRAIFPPAEPSQNSVANVPERWQELAPMPEPRASMASAAYDGNIYAIAGEGPEGVSGNVFRYITSEDRWEELSEKPTPVADVKGVLIGEKIYVPGGRLNDGRNTDVLEVYDPRMDSWEQKASLPIKVSGYALATHEGQMYLFGGWDGEKTLDITLRYDPSDNQWEFLTPMPTAREYAGAAEAGGKIYILGGWDGTKALDVNESYSPAQDSAGGVAWEMLSNFPNQDYGMAVQSVAEMVFVVGESGVFQYSPQTNLWTNVSSLETDYVPKFVGNTSFQGDMFLLGGGDSFTQKTDTWRFQMAYIIAVPIISK